MSSRVSSFILLMIFGVLSTITLNVMWTTFGHLTIYHMMLIFIIASLGESIVSSQGYYHYTRQERNGPFIRNVPIWIAFLWTFSIQGSLLIALLAGATGIQAILASGLIACLADLILFEPFLCRNKQLWRWTPVTNGYFRFIPSRFNRFTAPLGNYITWFLFPIIANGFLGLLTLIF
ncbi:MAG: hypothetical protein JW779_11000 [Candidatus Thorarchaeota archaeon]|nr:hypothetical protein [Candidatus Thorarchaeota archaeon]